MMTATTTAALPYQASAGSLARASIGAAVAAAAILTLVVLPAEWGIDPTGVGTALGLTRMAGGAEEVDEPDSPGVTAPAPASALVVPTQEKANIEAQTAWRTDEKTVTLPPHSGIEIKAHMQKGDRFIFRWSSTGEVRMDMHGEPNNAKPEEFTTYWKQKDLTKAQGSFTAPFEGIHGWYWRNGGDTPVTIKLDTAGFYRDLFEPPAG